MNGPLRDVERGRLSTTVLLLELHRRGVCREGDEFTRAQALDWVPELAPSSDRLRSAVQYLLRRSWVTNSKRLDEQCRTCVTYTLTAAGADAVRAAGGGKVLRTQPKGPSGARRPPEADTLAARLWALLRVRGMLDANSAVETLLDAGDDTASAVRTVRKYLSAWHKAGVLALSAQRVRGSKRYVLTQDAQHPPPVCLARGPVHGDRRP